MNLSRHLGTFSWSVAAKIPPFIYGAVLITVVIPSIGVEENGRYWVVFASYNWIALLNKSLILNPMIRFGAVSQQFDPIMRAGFYLNGLLYLLCGVILWMMAPAVAPILKVNASDLQYAPLLMAAFFVRDYCFCLQQTIYRTERIFIIEIVYYVGAALGFVYLVFCDALTTAQTVLNVNLWAAIASSIIALTLGFGGMRFIAPIDLMSVRRIIRYGVETLGLGVSNSLLYSADTWVLARLGTLSDVGIYNGAKAVWRVLSSVNQAMSLLILPYAARLEAQGQPDDRRALFEKTVAYSWMGLAVAAVVGGIIAKPFYAAFLGDEYIGSALLLIVMLIGSPFEGVFNVAATILYGVGSGRIAANVSFVGVGILVALLLPATYFFGTIGAATALSVSLIAVGVLMFRTVAGRLDSSIKCVAQRFTENIRTIIASGGKR